METVGENLMDMWCDQHSILNILEDLTHVFCIQKILKDMNLENMMFGY